MCALEAWSDTTIAPDFATLVNRAWFQFSWDAQTQVLEETVTTVVGQTSYVLTGQIKQLLDVVYDTTGAKSAMLHSSERYERNYRADWRVQPNGVSLRYTFQNFNTITLVPPPSAIVTVAVRYIGQGAAFVNPTDIPPIPDYYHEAIALYAAILQGEVYAQGEAEQRLAAYQARYEKYVADSLNYAGLPAEGEPS